MRQKCCRISHVKYLFPSTRLKQTNRLPDCQRHIWGKKILRKGQLYRWNYTLSCEEEDEEMYLSESASLATYVHTYRESESTELTNLTTRKRSAQMNRQRWIMDRRKRGSDVHVPLRMNRSNLSDPHQVNFITLQILWFKYLQNLPISLSCALRLLLIS